MARSLRFVTYLAPSIPAELFELVVRHVSRELGCDASLRLETLTSGPLRGEADPFSLGEADVGFVCTPSLLWLRELRPAPVELLPAAPVFDDPRAAGRPVYHSDVVVPRASAATRFEHLRGGTFAFNDPCSLSGYFSLLERLTASDLGIGFFGRLVESGSHLASLRMLGIGEVDGAAIDSNVLAHALRCDPGLGDRVRVLESWGPYPIQPLIVRAGVDRALQAEMAGALLTMDARPELGLLGFAPVVEADYEAERAALRACEALAPLSAVKAPRRS